MTLRAYPNFIKGLAMVKLAAGRANFETGGFSKEILTAIEGACQEIIDAAFEKLIEAFKAKGQEFSQILKMGRTQLQGLVFVLASRPSGPSPVS